MRIDRKKKIIYLDEKDSAFKIVLSNRKLADAIGLKTYIADKGFGLEVFSKTADTHKPKQNLLVFMENQGKPYETNYIGAWKLSASLRKRIAKRGVTKPGRKKLRRR